MEEEHVDAAGRSTVDLQAAESRNTQVPVYLISTLINITHSLSQGL